MPPNVWTNYFQIVEPITWKLLNQLHVTSNCHSCTSQAYLQTVYPGASKLLYETVTFKQLTANSRSNCLQYIEPVTFEPLDQLLLYFEPVIFKMSELH